MYDKLNLVYIFTECISKNLLQFYFSPQYLSYYATNFDASRLKPCLHDYITDLNHVIFNSNTKQQIDLGSDSQSSKLNICSLLFTFLDFSSRKILDVLAQRTSLILNSTNSTSLKGTTYETLELM